MTSSSFVEEPAPRAHRQCRRRSPPTGWSSGDLIPKGTPPPPLDAITGNRTRGPSPDPRAVAAAHDADHPLQLLHPRPSPTPRTPAPSRSRTRRLPPVCRSRESRPPSPAGAMEVAGEEGIRPHGLLPERTPSREAEEGQKKRPPRHY
ncbi:uncharacterized protein LOC120667975 [Panicum virgatum]|uniref:uncharacterized protein LOC120667975 n=1 Tax=Panicum virgatum TaxID=38727 RepID=UPI0019D63631|nr:uncharacterized protein LOC120667975 [Panicum virgatum]